MAPKSNVKKDDYLQRFRNWKDKNLKLRSNTVATQITSSAESKENELPVPPRSSKNESRRTTFDVHQNRRNTVLAVRPSPNMTDDAKLKTTKQIKFVESRYLSSSHKTAKPSSTTTQNGVNPSAGRKTIVKTPAKSITNTRCAPKRLSLSKSTSRLLKPGDNRPASLNRNAMATTSANHTTQNVAANNRQRLVSNNDRSAGKSAGVPTTKPPMNRRATLANLNSSVSQRKSTNSQPNSTITRTAHSSVKATGHLPKLPVGSVISKLSSTSAVSAPDSISRSSNGRFKSTSRIAPRNTGLLKLQNTKNDIGGPKNRVANTKTLKTGVADTKSGAASFKRGVTSSKNVGARTTSLVDGVNNRRAANHTTVMDRRRLTMTKSTTNIAANKTPLLKGTKVSDWNSAKDKTPSRYRHCRCFDVTTEAPADMLTDAPADQPTEASHSMTMGDTVCGHHAAVGEPMDVTEDVNQCDVKDTEADTKNVPTADASKSKEVTQGELSEEMRTQIDGQISQIMESSQKGAAAVDLVGWAEDIIETVPLANQHAALWVCMARLALRTGDNDAVMTTFERGIKAGAGPRQVMLEGMKDVICEMTANTPPTHVPTPPHDATTPPTNTDTTDHTTPFINHAQPSIFATPATPRTQMVQLQNVFESSAIKYTVREGTPLLKRMQSSALSAGLTSPYKIITPVRRSTRKSLATIPEMLREKDAVYSTISGLPKSVKVGALYQPNLDIPFIDDIESVGDSGLKPTNLLSDL